MAHGTGFSGPIELVMAADKDFQKIKGYSVLASSETPGFGDQMKNDYYRNQFVNAPAERLTLVEDGQSRRDRCPDRGDDRRDGHQPGGRRSSSTRSWCRSRTR